MKNPVECKFCCNKNLIFLYNKIFCSKCNIYYHIENNDWIPTPIHQSILSRLCNKCKDKKGKILCSDIEDYIKKSLFCKDCKQRVIQSIKYNFIRYNDIYKKNVNIVAWYTHIFIILYFIYVTLYYNDYYYFIFDFIFFFRKYKIFLIPVVYYTDIGIINFLLFIHYLYKYYFTTKIIYSVPVIMDDYDDELYKKIERLVID